MTYKVFRTLKKREDRGDADKSKTERHREPERLGQTNRHVETQTGSLPGGGDSEVERERKTQKVIVGGWVPYTERDSERPRAKQKERERRIRESENVETEDGKMIRKASEGSGKKEKLSRQEAPPERRPLPIPGPGR